MQRCQGLMAAFAILAATVVPVAGHADADADAVIRKIQDTYVSARTLSAEITITGVIGPNHQKLRFAGQVRMKKPNLWRYEVQGVREESLAGEQGYKYTLISDGKTSWKVGYRGQRFVQEPTVQQRHIMAPMDPLSWLFFSDTWLSTYLGRHQSRFLADQKIDGVVCRCVQILTHGIDTGAQLQFYFDSEYHVRRIVQEELGMSDAKVDLTLKNLKINQDIEARAFSYSPPAELIESKQPVVRMFWFQGFFLEEYPSKNRL